MCGSCSYTCDEVLSCQVDNAAIGFDAIISGAGWLRRLGECVRGLLGSAPLPVETKVRTGVLGCSLGPQGGEGYIQSFALALFTAFVRNESLQTPHRNAGRAVNLRMKLHSRLWKSWGWVPAG